MAPAAVGTVVLAIFLVAGVAVWLIAVPVKLQQITHSLDTVLDAVTGIAGQVKPAPGVVGSIARDVGAIQGALHGLIALATGGAPAPAAAAPAPAPAPARTPGRRVASSAAAAPADAPEQRSGPNLPPPVHRRACRVSSHRRGGPAPAASAGASLACSGS